MLFQKVIYGNIVNKVTYGNTVNMMFKITEHPIYNRGQFASPLLLGRLSPLLPETSIKLGSITQSVTDLTADPGVTRSNNSSAT